MVKPCEAERTEQEIVIRTWSGTRRGRICDLNQPGVVNHWVSVENWKLHRVDVDSLVATIRGGNPFAKFDCPGASNVTPNKWDERIVTTVPAMEGGSLLQRLFGGGQGQKEWGYVTLLRTGLVGSENVFVEVETSWRNGRQGFSLDIRVDT